MRKCDVVSEILKKVSNNVMLESASAFAPSNIALCKYWGKRNTELNLPVTNSLSISLADKGAEVTFNHAEQDEICLNNNFLSLSDKFSQRLFDFVNLFRKKNTFFKVDIKSNIPIAAGLASSACGFAAIVLALNKIYQWDLSKKDLSILARLGSGSAARSIENGFVEWHKGVTSDGSDSYAERLEYEWPEFSIGLMILDNQEKKISSRQAMLQTVQTSPLYYAWPAQVSYALDQTKKALRAKDFNLLGKIAEDNAEAMHATMLNAVPPIQYVHTETNKLKEKIWKLRAEGLSLYFTQDAGPNLKLLFLQEDIVIIKKNFPAVEIVQPFANNL